MDERTKRIAAKCLKRIQEAKNEVLNENPFYGFLMMHLSFALTTKVKTCCIDKKKFYINPDYLDSLTDIGLQFIILHELTHMILKHPSRRLETNEDEWQLFDEAADLVSNSTVLESLGLSDLRPFSFSSEKVSHTAPDGKEAGKYSVEQLISMFMLPPSVSKSPDDKENGGGEGDSEEDGSSGGSSSERGGRYLRDDKPLDDHSTWPNGEEEAKSETVDWQSHMLDAALASENFGQKGWGNIPGAIRELIENLKNPKVDWRVVLHDFIQEEINDYSFSPPDRRFSESDFFLPDFNDTEAVIKNLYFYIDTSGSMSDEEIADLFSEIKGAIDQFNGKLQGKIGFFDALATKPIPFEDKKDLSFERIYGGGGTCFEPIFSAIKEDIEENSLVPACIIIMTDGYAPFPEEDITDDIPVLWAINNNDITPPWGKIIRVL